MQRKGLTKNPKWESYIFLSKICKTVKQGKELDRLQKNFNEYTCKKVSKI